jgi:hypothetical protein
VPLEPRHRLARLLVALEHRRDELDLRVHHLGRDRLAEAALAGPQHRARHARREGARLGVGEKELLLDAEGVRECRQLVVGCRHKVSG